MTPTVRLLAPFALCGLVLGCSSGGVATIEPALAPAFGADKADAADAVDRLGAIEPAGERSGVFVEDLEFHGYELVVRDGAAAALEITQKGTSKALDTTLYVYGPRNAAGQFGTKALAFDDDSGWGRYSKLASLALPQGGTYLVVVGTRDGRGRGAYRLTSKCTTGECGPLPVETSGGCPAALRAALDNCVADAVADPEYDAWNSDHEHLITQCADAEPMAPAYDALCAAGGDAALCALGMEGVSRTVLPVCRSEAVNSWLDERCVFGETYRDLFSGNDAVIVVSRRTATTPGALTALEAAQLVAAVRSTAYEGIETAEGAFEVIDQGQANLSTLWDASNRRAYTAVEVGAGDNSFGAIFAHGSDVPEVSIVDGTFEGCARFTGAEHRRCASDAECSGGTRCHGTSETVPFGRCRDPKLDDHAAEGTECSEDTLCPVEAGLICIGESVGYGLCGPTWMRGRFESRPELTIPDDGSDRADAQIAVFGLTTVPVDAWLDFTITHPRPADLVLSLTNPAGTTVPVTASMVGDGGEVRVERLAVGVPGDEMVNGLWTLTVVDQKSGESGVLQEFALDLTSRWD